LPSILASAGYIVVVVRIGPLSSNQERACEIYAQLTNINNEGNHRYGPKSSSSTLCPSGYDLPTDTTPGRIAVRYGTNHPAAHLGLLSCAWTWRPVVFGNVTSTWNWRWSAENPVHFICHSQGGITVRYLVEILSSRHQTQFPGAHFPKDDCQNWVKSVVTIGTPHKGTTATDIFNVRI
jgi:triacylglycerol esterase/lipase EstA (alpha/beta hydrolase family)